MVKKGLEPSNRLKPSDPSREERLTADEVRRVKDLAREGMKPEIARAEVLRKRGEA